MPERGKWIEACGRDTFWGLCIERIRVIQNPLSPIVQGRVDMDARRKVPVGPDTIVLDGIQYDRVMVAKAGRNRYLCLTCGTWVCARCGHKRLYANRRYTGVWSCPKKTCSSRKGHMRVGYHTLDRWWDHNDADIQLGSTTGMAKTKSATGEGATG
jgi:hypothetical protein